jgi:uncharacterized protein (DUF697 family)
MEASSNGPADQSPKSPTNGVAAPPAPENGRAPTAAETPGIPAKREVLCRTKARSIVRKYAAFGTAISALPLPPGTSAALAALETHLIYYVGKVYGEDLTHAETMIVASTLNVAGMALRTLAREGVGLIPVVGWGVRAAIAGSGIMGIGELAIRHYEMKYPDKMTVL